MSNFTFTEQERILKSKINLNFSHPFFSYILLNFNIKEGKEDKIPTMGVNEYGDLLWNEKFVSTLTDNQLNGVLSHEAMHVATLTFQRKGNRDMLLWNIATDLIINTLLLKDGLELPKDCVRPDSSGNYKFEGKNGKVTIDKVIEKTAEEIYDIFVNNAEQVKIAMNGNSETGDYDGSFDKHADGDSSKDAKDGEGNGNGEGEGKGKGEGKGEGKEDKSSQASKNANKEKWKKIATEAMTNAKMRGKGNSIIERDLGKLLNPEIDWRVRLSQFITKDLPVDYTMRLPGRRYYSTGVYYPSIIRENLDVVVAIDVSGSISDKEYNKFMTEVVSIANSFEQINLRVLWWSTEILAGDDIQVVKCNADEITTHKFKSTGGTEMSCVADYIKKNNINSRVYVFLSDGMIENKPKVPDGKILFVLAGDGNDNIIKKYGDVCKLKMY
jgi:predicted metal-dependent peptidase